jgi:hypothetical protein
MYGEYVSFSVRHVIEALEKSGQKLKNFLSLSPSIILAFIFHQSGPASGLETFLVRSDYPDAAGGIAS